MKRRLEEIEARLAASTPGPWTVEGDEVLYDLDPYATDEGISDCRVMVVKQHSHVNNADTLQFIANAPTDIADLLAVVKLQREALEEISKSIVRPESMTDACLRLGGIEKKCNTIIEAADKILGGDKWKEDYE